MEIGDIDFMQVSGHVYLVSCSLPSQQETFLTGQGSVTFD